MNIWSVFRCNIVFYFVLYLSSMRHHSAPRVSTPITIFLPTRLCQTNIRCRLRERGIMVGSHFHTLLHGASRTSLLKSTSNKPFFNNTIKNYGQASNGNRSRLMEERAPSTAEEFQRVAQEKARETKEGVATQNVDKLYDGAQEGGDSKVRSVKN